MTKLIVVAGAAGKLGRLIVEALLEHPAARVRALVRDPRRPEAAALAGPRVDVIAFDAAAATAEERAAAVRGAFAVVSTLQGGPDIIVDAQLALLRAARAAGARRFIPSDFSYDLFKLPAGINVNSDWRRTLGERARAEVSSTFEVVHVLQGIFADRVVLGFLGLLDSEHGVIRYWGDGETPIDWTTWEDTARFTAAAAMDEGAVPERLAVRGDRMTVLAFARAWGAARGRTPTLVRLGSLADLQRETSRRIAEAPSDMLAWLPLMYARGVFEGEALLGPIHNDRYPAVRAETVAQALERGAI
jgi:nucleoside-diphosphate-sugar epimerase